MKKLLLFCLVSILLSVSVNSFAQVIQPTPKRTFNFTFQNPSTTSTVVADFNLTSNIPGTLGSGQFNLVFYKNTGIVPTATQILPGVYAFGRWADKVSLDAFFAINYFNLYTDTGIISKEIPGKGDVNIEVIFGGIGGPAIYITN